MPASLCYALAEPDSIILWIGVAMISAFAVVCIMYVFASCDWKNMSRRSAASDPMASEPLTLGNKILSDVPEGGPLSNMITSLIAHVFNVPNRNSVNAGETNIPLSRHVSSDWLITCWVFLGMCMGWLLASVAACIVFRNNEFVLASSVASLVEAILFGVGAAYFVAGSYNSRALS